MINTVIFDMDGVIVDTEPVHHYAYHQHFKELEIDVSEEMYATFTGNSTRNVYERIKEAYKLSYDVEMMVDNKRNIFNNAFDLKEDLDMLPGVKDLIADLHSNGIQLILASSSAKVTIERIFKRFGLHQYFTHIVSGEDFEKSKPHPAIFEHAASLSVAPKNECIVIEDSTNGVRAAKAAGLYCVGYNSEHSKLQDLSEADVVISHFNELTAGKIKDITT
ncbi:MAG: HAD family hydrolase [Flavobacterium sp.]|nr:MAG: HAD family hydrolase [Flavobacterium sp.]